ncbi:MAG: RluA family pseudouridine synthase [Pseudomonadota bacterium]|nr:RluA family pseudouridine synthase [Pseudomonadota bacterium]
MQLVTLTEQQANQRIDNYLIKILKGVPKTYIYRIIRKGEVRVNKKRVNAKSRLKPGDIVRIPPVRRATTQTPEINDQIAQSISSRVVFEDRRVIVLDKAAGIAVHGGSGINLGLIEALRQVKPQWSKAELAHRLDRDTSGLLLICKNRAALHYYHDLFRDHKAINKRYLVLVHGRWKGDQVIKQPLERYTAANNERFVRVSANGKPSETRFELVEQWTSKTQGEFSLLRATLITGRTHQIRVHCQFAGHPIVGDSKYGQQETDQALGKPRLMLHAQQLSLVDEAGEQQHWQSTPDDNWQQWIKTLKQ